MGRNGAKIGAIAEAEARGLALEMGVADPEGLEMMAAELIEASRMHAFTHGWTQEHCREIAVHLRRMAIRARNTA